MNCYNLLPAHAPFEATSSRASGGETISWFSMQYSQHKNIMISLSEDDGGLLMVGRRFPMPAVRAGRHSVWLASMRKKLLESIGGTEDS